MLTYIDNFVNINTFLVLVLNHFFIFLTFYLVILFYFLSYKTIYKISPFQMIFTSWVWYDPKRPLFGWKLKEDSTSTLEAPKEAKKNAVSKKKKNLATDDTDLDQAMFDEWHNVWQKKNQKHPYFDVSEDVKVDRILRGGYVLRNPKNKAEWGVIPPPEDPMFPSIKIKWKKPEICESYPPKVNKDLPCFKKTLKKPPTDKEIHDFIYRWHTDAVPKYDVIRNEKGAIVETVSKGLKFSNEFSKFTQIPFKDWGRVKYHKRAVGATPDNEMLYTLYHANTLDCDKEMDTWLQPSKRIQKFNVEAWHHIIKKRPPTFITDKKPELWTHCYNKWNSYHMDYFNYQYVWTIVPFVLMSLGYMVLSRIISSKFKCEQYFFFNSVVWSPTSFFFSLHLVVARKHNLWFIEWPIYNIFYDFWLILIYINTITIFLFFLSPTCIYLRGFKTMHWHDTSIYFVFSTACILIVPLFIQPNLPFWKEKEKIFLWDAEKIQFHDGVYYFLIVLVFLGLLSVIIFYYIVIIPLFIKYLIFKDEVYLKHINFHLFAGKEDNSDWDYTQSVNYMLREYVEDITEYMLDDFVYVVRDHQDSYVLDKVFIPSISWNYYRFWILINFFLLYFFCKIYFLYSWPVLLVVSTFILLCSLFFLFLFFKVYLKQTFKPKNYHIILCFIILFFVVFFFKDFLYVWSHFYFISLLYILLIGFFFKKPIFNIWVIIQKKKFFCKAKEVYINNISPVICNFFLKNLDFLKKLYTRIEKMQIFIFIKVWFKKKKKKKKKK